MIARMLLLCTFLLLAGSAFAGVILTDEDGSRTYLQDGKLMEVDEEGNPEVIFNSGDGRVVFFNGDDRTYVETTPKEWCSETKAQYEAMMDQLPPESRAQVKAMMEKSKAALTLEKKGTEEIAGFNTTKYVILRDGQPYEYYWVTDNKKLLNEAGNWKGIIDMTAEVGECMMQNVGMDESSAGVYRKLFESGMPIRNVEAEEERRPAGALEVEYTDLPASTFAPPENYTRVGIREMMGGN